MSIDKIVLIIFLGFVGLMFALGAAMYLWM